jgi:hypothetical protein
MKTPIALPWKSKLAMPFCVAVLFAVFQCHSAPVDVAPFGILLPEGDGILWEDPREIHEVVARFKEAPPAGARLEYWGSRWPEQRLPKDREPGGGDVRFPTSRAVGVRGEIVLPS